MLPKEYVIPQYQTTVAVANKPLANQECLGKTLRLGLHRILKFNAIIRAIAKQVFKTELVFRRGDNQGFPYARQH